MANINPDVQKSLEKIKSDSEHPLHGLLATMKASVDQLDGSWQFQIFNNIDEISSCLRNKLSEKELEEFIGKLESFVKKPLRRQMGRIKAISRSIGELYRYLS